MNLITSNAQIIFLTAHGGGLSLYLAAPLVQIADARTGDSVTATMQGEPPQANYACTHLYRYDPATRSFSVLDAIFLPGERQKTLAGLQNLTRYAWLPVAYDTEGKYVPAAVVSALVTDGSLGVVESVKAGLVQLLRDDPALAAWHPQWAEPDETRAHVFDGAIPGGRSAGRAPFIEVETKAVTHGTPFVLHASYQLNLMATHNLDSLADDVLAALTAEDNRWLRSKHVISTAIRCETPDRGFPAKRMAIIVEAQLALKA